MRIPSLTPLLFLLLRSPAALASTPAEIAKNPDPECTVTSPHSENFFDLRPLRRHLDQEPLEHDYYVKGQDYGANFTINICSPLLTDTSDAEGLSQKARLNVSAMYERDGVQYSIGSSSSEPKFRGRKLTLSYTDGSPCPYSEHSRKATLFSLMCDREAFRKPSFAFVGEFDECSYFFEIRTAAACPKIKPQAIGPVGVFGVIALVAGVVYCLGGCVYQRTVLHARGWRQIPHYHAWASALNFISDLFTSSCSALASRFRRRRYSPLNTNANSGNRRVNLNGNNTTSARAAGNTGRRSSLDAENQLIDELDDDWGSDI